MRRNHSILKEPQQGGIKSEVAASPLPPRGPKRGRKCDVAPAFSGVPNKGEENQKWLPHPYLLEGPKDGGNATLPLNSWGCPAKVRKTTSALPRTQKPSPWHSRGSPTKGITIGTGYLTLACSGPKRRRKCYVTPQKWLPHPCLPARPKDGGNPMSPLHSRGSPTKGDQNQKWLPHPCLLGGPKDAGNATSPLHSRRSPMQRRDHNQKWLPPLAFSGAQKRAEMLCNPYVREEPQQRGTKSEVAASPLPSRRSKRRRKCYVTAAFSGVPTAKRGDHN